jgi:hypothetical protein
LQVFGKATMSGVNKPQIALSAATVADLYAELEKLDRDWLADCPRYAMRVKRGWYYFPKVAESVVGTILLCGVSGGVVIAMVFASYSSQSDRVFGIDGFVILSIGMAITLLLLWNCVGTICRSVAYEKALAAYEKQRLLLTSKLGVDRNYGRLDYANFDRRFGAR